MSSVVKKSSRFMPKLRKQPLKKRSVPPPTPPTPGPTQINDQPSQKEIEQVKANQDVLETEVTPISPQPTQDQQPENQRKNSIDVTSDHPQVQFNFELNKSSKLAVSSTREDSAIPPEIAVSSGDEIDEEYGDNDIFSNKLPDINTKVRRQSSINKQRLSGITPSIIRHRSSSVSLHQSPFFQSSTHPDDNSPVKIGIPQAKFAKRRRSSVRTKRKDLAFGSRSSSISIDINQYNKPSSDVSNEAIKIDVNEENNQLPKKHVNDVSSPHLKQDSPELTEKVNEEKELHLKESGNESATATQVTINREKIMQLIDEENSKPDGAFKVPTSGPRRSSRLSKKTQNVAVESEEKDTTREPKTVKAAKTSKAATSKESNASEDTSKGVIDPKITEADTTTNKAKQVNDKIPIQDPGTKYKLSIKSVRQLTKEFRHVDPKDLDEITISEDSMVMSDLCRPEIYFGKPGSRYLQVIEGKKHIEEKKLERKKFRDNARKQKKSVEEVSGEIDEPVDKKKDILSDSYNGNSSQAANVLQLKMVGDSITLDQDSTSVDRHANVSMGNRDREEANPFNNPITSSSYSKRKYTDRWQPNEVDQFYKALSTWGTDFTLIAQIFPHRTRKQIKLKFNLEERKHPEIVELALRRQLPADFNKYCDDANKKFQTLEVYNDELKELRIKHEQDMEQYRIDRERAKKEDQEEARNKEIKKRMGAAPLRRLNVKTLRENEVVVGSIDDRKRHKLEEAK